MARLAGSGRRARANACPGGAASALVLAAALGGCRDAPEPFDAADRGPAATGTARLTYSTTDEHAPAWSADGSRIVYSAPGFAPFPESEGLLLSIPAGGGAPAEPLLPTLQIGTMNPGVLTAPALTTDGGRVVFLQILRLLSSEACAPPPFPVACDGQFAVLAPMLLQGRLRVREIGGAADPAADPALDLRPEGFSRDEPVGLVEVRVLRDFPFQRAIRVDGIYEVGPSWDPDGGTVAFSDGRRLLLWTPGSDPVPIAGTEGGLSPAWSPDGAWIAFAREALRDSTVVTCTQSGAFGTFCELTEILYETDGPAIELVRPDGSDGRILSLGREPAWSPDGSRVFFAADDGIRSIGIDGGAEALVPATAGGREPAVSPDGSRLAFTRRSGSGGFDLWVTPIP
ncbi:MAG TPA: hypothetical protein VML95_11765 [Longimicrobiales bacterium]|nr:hypothetical protein [Longimicrobiales bacterium]